MSTKKLQIIGGQMLQSDWNTIDMTSQTYIKNKPSIPAQASDIGAIASTEKGAANGVATLDENGKVSSGQLPAFEQYIPTSEKGVANGVATLGSDGKVLSTQLPQIQSAIYHLGNTAPENTSLLWIDTTAVTGGLKYYNGESWVTVPVRFA